jgi:hypothetical protein
VVLSYWHKTKCHSSLDSALHKIAWYDPESLATKKKQVNPLILATFSILELELVIPLVPQEKSCFTN